MRLREYGGVCDVTWARKIAIFMSRRIVILAAGVLCSLSIESEAQVQGIPCIRNGECTFSSVTMTGQFLAADGTAGAPSYSFSNDPDVGMFSNGPNNIGWATSGALRMSLSGATLASEFTGGSWILRGGISAASATSTTPGISLQCSSNALDDDDGCVTIENSAGTDLFTIDALDGDVVILGGAVITGGIQAGTGFSTFSGGASTGSSVLTGTPVGLRGDSADGAAANGVVSRTNVTYSTAGADIHEFQNLTTTQARIDKDGFFLSVVQSDATGGAYTLTPTSEYVSLNPASNATVTLGETGVQDGSRVCILLADSDFTAAFADTAGVSELAGAFTMDSTGDSLCLIYKNNTWAEISRSNN